MDRLASIEEGIRRNAERLPGLPVTEALLCRVIMLVARALTTHIDEVIRPYELSDVEFRTLLALFSAPDGLACPSELCASLAHSPASMTRIGDVLVARNLVTRVLSEQDRRRMDIQITPQGEALVREVLPGMFGFTRDLYRQFSEAEKQRLLEGLKKLFAQITQDGGTADTGSQANAGGKTDMGSGTARGGDTDKGGEA